jgi:hypothetical protein
MRVDERRICHSILANSANQIPVCFYWLNGGRRDGSLPVLSKPCQPTALLVLNRLQLVHPGVVSCTSCSLLTLSFSLRFSHLTFLQGRSKMTRNVTRQDKFCPSGYNATRFKFETLIFERNAAHLDGLPSSLSKTRSYRSIPIESLRDCMTCRDLF